MTDHPVVGRADSDRPPRIGPPRIDYWSWPRRTGLGDSGFDVQDALIAAGADIAWVNATQPSTQTSRPDIDAAIIHSPPDVAYPLPGRPTKLVANMVWETDRIPQWWHEYIDRFDDVVVPSRFVADVFEASRVTKPVHVMPHVVCEPAPPLPESVVSGFGIPDDHVVLYTIGTWTQRKAMDANIRTFLRAFTRRDPVSLIVKTTTLDLIASLRLGRHTSVLPTIGRLLTEAPKRPPVHVIAGDRSQATMDALHRRGDCYVALTHGEGFGLPFAHAVAAGNPAITTGWGAAPELVPPGYRYLVDHRVERIDESVRDLWFRPPRDARWATADEDHAVELMRDVVTNGPQVGGAARFITELCEPSAIARSVLRLL